jgi:hypothetical protein
MKRLLAAALFSAALILSLGGTAAAQSTRTYSLINGDTLSPASPSYDPSGAPAYSGGLVAGQLAGGAGGVFTLSITFRGTGAIDPDAGIYGGEIVSPFSSFVVTENSGRKSVSTSGSIDAGTLTYRLTPDGRAEILSVVSGGLTVWKGQNKRRTAVGQGTLRYGADAEGTGTIVLTF